MKSLILALFILFFCGIATTDNAVDISIQSFGGSDFDTLYFEIESQFIIAIENDIPLYGMSLGFEIFSPDDVGWIWADMGPYGYGPAGPGTGHACVTVISGSRIDPPESAFDITGLSVTEYDMDEEGSDIIMVGGVATTGGLSVGGLEQMIALNFLPTPACGESPWDVFTLCIDSIFVPPSGAFVFVDASIETTTPQVLWDFGGACFPATNFRNLPPQLMDGVALTQVTYTGSRMVENAAVWEDPCLDPISISLKEINGGFGIAEVVDRGDGTCDIIYYADESDLGNTVSVAVEALDPYHFMNPCNLHTLSFEVVEQPECLLGGDANDDGQMNVGDVVFIINYSFKGGPPPDIPRAADANRDCDINVGDAVYLIGSIFKGGPTPQCSDCDF